MAVGCETVPRSSRDVRRPRLTGRKRLVLIFLMNVFAFSAGALRSLRPSRPSFWRV